MKDLGRAELIVKMAEMMHPKDMAKELMGKEKLLGGRPTFSPTSGVSLDSWRERISSPA